MTSRGGRNRSAGEVGLGRNTACRGNREVGPSELARPLSPGTLGTSRIRSVGVEHHETPPRTLVAELRAPVTNGILNGTVVPLVPSQTTALQLSTRNESANEFASKWLNTYHAPTTVRGPARRSPTRKGRFALPRGMRHDHVIRSLLDSIVTYQRNPSASIGLRY